MRTGRYYVFGAQSGRPFTSNSNNGTRGDGKMIDETDLSMETRWLFQERSMEAIKHLHRRNINAQFCPNRQEALSATLDMIPAGTTVVRGDSVSVDQVGIIPSLMEHNRNTIIDPFDRKPDGQYKFGIQERLMMQKAAFSADIYIAGSNAITIDGKLVNTDAVGNRVAPMIFGPDKVILIIGANKIVRNVDEAIKRIREICAPINAKRHAIKHHRADFGNLPCARTGRCADCYDDWRICRYTVIIEGSLLPQKGRINVVLIGENLGI